ncbi:hypothetical protein P167DRAFT_118734 [Morchella conica CCBAS932]|uniref:Uncharacterized protein n=1 Tax=Morchella conica CCBAS932 TaxID=1392247 RepID=A0A3N4L6R1_9PEZI|nr:hypothetical protein P167DRAFT_118734 [Morchella conica CCBAS932]
MVEWGTVESIIVDTGFSYLVNLRLITLEVYYFAVVLPERVRTRNSRGNNASILLLQHSFGEMAFQRSKVRMYSTCGFGCTGCSLP